MTADTTTSRPRDAERHPETPATEPGQAPSRPAAVRLRARRNPRLIVIGVLCACLGALGMGWAWHGAQRTQPVILVNRDITRGEKIKAGDLKTTTIGPAPEVQTVPADRLESLIGQYAQVDLRVGALLSPAAVGPELLPAGNAQVGLLLAAGRLPSQSLRSGDQVLLVAIPAPGSGEPPAGPPRRFNAAVASPPQALSDGQRWLVDVELAEDQAVEVAALAAAERIALVRKAGGR